MELHVYGIPYGIMCWWTPEENAAVYHVNLFVEHYANGQTELKIKTEDVDRNTLTHSFLNLGSSKWNKAYYLQVEAEDRDGNVIEMTDMVDCEIIADRTGSD